MSIPAPEFSRPVRIDTIGDSPRAIAVEATGGERDALAARFGLAGITHLAGSVTLRRNARGIAAEGRIKAALTQVCVATGDPVSESIDQPFELLFVENADGVEAEEMELDAEDLDIVDYDGQAVDLGEALAQTMALAMDPFPRSPNADAILRAAGVISEEDARPLGALAGLKAAMEKKGK